MKPINTIYAILSALLIATMIFGLCSCGASALPKDGTYKMSAIIEYDCDGNKIGSAPVDNDTKIEIKVEDENTIALIFNGTEFYFNKNTNGVFMGSLGGIIQSTMTWEGKTLTITDLDPDTGLADEAVQFTR